MKNRLQVLNNLCVNITPSIYQQTTIYPNQCHPFFEKLYVTKTNFRMTRNLRPQIKKLSDLPYPNTRELIRNKNLSSSSDPTHLYP